MKTLIICCFLAAACAAPEKKAAGDPAAPPQHMPAAELVAEPRVVRGTVREVIQSGDFTYVRLDTGSSEEWLLMNRTPLTSGSTITAEVTMTLRQFTAKSLDRTFDRVLFAKLPSTSAAANEPLTMPKAEKTVAEIWDQRESLDGKRVSVRGRVVKFLPGIMGRNWVHLRDGSGSPEKGNDDLTVTTDQTAAPGDTVLVNGTVAINRDFGAGYTYPVIIEQARMTK